MDLKGNDKRRESCKKMGSEKKKTGHKREEEFGELFCDPSNITYKAEADKTITNSALLDILRRKLGVLSGRTSIKSGNNLQFTLGNIPEITNAEDKLQAISQVSVWNKYLGKNHSSAPADILSYRENRTWIFFNMHHVINFIVSSATWRIIDSGRIKGDFEDSSKKGKSQYLTYEYRSGKGYFLGANGNRGKPFIVLLTKNLLYHIEEDK
jgi:hypothetical protein